jgi:two-component system NtrC family sensor kinase
VTILRWSTFRRWAMSLRVAVIVAALVGVAVPTVLVSLDNIDHLRTEYLANLDTEAARTTELVAMSMREPIWQFAPDQAESIIEAAFLDPRVLAISVYDVNGQSFVSRRRGETDKNITRNVTRVMRQGNPVGHVELIMSTLGYQNAVNESFQRMLLGILISVVASVVLIALLLHFRLVRPVSRLVLASETVAAGNLDVPIPVERNDEIGRLGESLESMREKLSHLVAQLERSNEELRQTNETLEVRVYERTRDLEQALEKLVKAQHDMVESEKLASLGRIVAGVAHELNTPIGNALTVASTIADGMRPLIAEYQSGNVRRSTLAAVVSSDTGISILLRNLERAARMIGNFKQVAVDQTSEQRRPFDLSSVTDEVLSTLAPSIRKAGHTVLTELAPDLRCDSFPGPYGQVLTNLVMNSLLHAFPEGTVGNIRIATSAVGNDFIRLTVEDDGQGMSDEVKRRIFDPFFTTRMGSGGSGLGMNIVQGFVTRVLGGSIRVESTLGKGSRFIVELPRRAPGGGDTIGL